MTREEAKHIVDIAFNVPLAVRKSGEERTYHEIEVRKAKEMAIKALSTLDKVIAYCKQSPSAILPEDVLSLIRGEDVEIETDYGYEKFEPSESKRCMELAKSYSQGLRAGLAGMANQDAISRQAVLDLIADYDLSMGQVVKGIHALPSVTPQEPKTGHWIQTNEFFINQDGQFIYNFICSECKSLSYFRKSNKKAIGANVCPNCGVKMVEPQERSSEE